MPPAGQKLSPATEPSSQRYGHAPARWSCSLFHAPKYYFVAGYIVLVAGTACFFLCLIPMLPTFGCLAFCSTLFILPTFMAISRGYRLLPA